MKQKTKLTDLLQKLLFRRHDIITLFGIFGWIYPIQNEIPYYKYKIICSMVVSALRASVHSPKYSIPDIIPRLYSTGFHHSEMLHFKPELVNEIFYSAKPTSGLV